MTTTRTKFKAIDPIRKKIPSKDSSKPVRKKVKENLSNGVDDYIQAFPQEVQDILQTLRRLIREEVPDAEETISYGVPTFKRNGKYVVYFAGFKKHISLYPVFDEMEKTLKEIAKYRTGRGTLQFLIGKPLPYPLIRKIIKIMVKENTKRTQKSS